MQADQGLFSREYEYGMLAYADRVAPYRVGKAGSCPMVGVPSLAGGTLYQDHNEEADVYAAHDHDDHEACWY